ncbi:MAG TPA: hypothetical protein VGN90_15975 [Pyrinomonadaceae bacterium]|jgi:hypothetical protein|nr:hypothetical protein [Pyrinomonadaceae bacterium]
MVPHRMLSNEINGSGLRERVTACRKRLRVHRVSHRQPHALDEANELFPEIVPAVSGFPDCLTDLSATLPIHHAYSRASECNELQESEALQLTEGPEVGIT